MCFKDPTAGGANDQTLTQDKHMKFLVLNMGCFLLKPKSCTVN